ncbi:MAG: rhodanese-like domain-containing protein [Pseudomonadota bacterium]
MEAGDPLVSADWLKQNFDAPHVKIVDATWVPGFLKDRTPGPHCYQEAHIPGAVYFDIDAIADTSSGLSHMLPEPKLFARQVGELGLSNDDLIVVYDSNGFFASARVWWMFRAMGHDQIKVLDGGLAAWQANGGATETGIQGAHPVTFMAEPQPNLVRDQAQMRAHVVASDINILDARAEGRFNGTAPEPRAGLPSGHMPGSFCVPATALLTETGTMKSSEALRDSLAPFETGPVVTSCGSGVSAAIISLALARVGNWDAALYDGSWSEWAANPDNPIETVT